MLQDELYMREAIRAAGNNRRAPFGAVLVDERDGRRIATGCNRTSDGPLWHGEIDVIHRASAGMDRDGWQHCHLYTTAEPCCMCQGAILWAGIRRVVFGTSIETLAQLGWRQIDITAEAVARRAAWADCELRGGVLAAECDRLFAEAGSK